MGTARKGMVWKGQCTVGRVSYLGRVNHTQVTYPTKPNLPTSQTFIICYPSPNPTLGTQARRMVPSTGINPTLPWSPSYPYPSLPYLSTLLFPTLPYPKELPYRINRWENTLSYLECLFNLPHPRHLNLQTFTHLTYLIHLTYLYPPYTTFITYPARVN